MDPVPGKAEQLKYGGMELVWAGQEALTWGEKYLLIFNEPPEDAPVMGTWNERRSGIEVAIGRNEAQLNEARVSIGPGMMEWVLAEDSDIELYELLKMVIIAIRDGGDQYGGGVMQYNIEVPVLEPVEATHVTVSGKPYPISQIPELDGITILVEPVVNVPDQWLVMQIQTLSEECQIPALQFGRKANQYSIVSE